MSLFPPIPVLDTATMHEAQQRLSTSVGSSLGRLGDLGVWIAGSQAQFPPNPLEDMRLVIFAGDHGLSQHGSPFSLSTQKNSSEAYRSIEAGESMVNAYARAQDIRIDLHNIDLDLSSHPVRSSGRADHDDSMDADLFQKSIERGISIADAHIDEGAQILLLGDIGVGNELISTAIIATLLQKEPTKVLPRTADIEDDMWKTRVSILRDSMFRVREDRRDVEELARRLGSPAMVAMAAFLAQSSLRKTPVILDGITSVAVGLLAEGIAPGAKSWWLSGMGSSHPAHLLGLEELSLSPLLDYSMTLDQGTGAVVAASLVRMATNSLSEIAMN